MVLRPDTVQARLLKLEEIVSFLEGYAEADRTALIGNLRDLWAAERALQVGAEAIFDVGNHILSASYGTSAVDYRDILGKLVLRGVISAELHDRLKGLGGFRNILVHDYLELDPERVVDNVFKAPKDFGAYVGAIRTWLEAHSTGGSA